MSGAGGSTKAPGSSRILVVDADVAELRDTVRLLEREGYEVRGAETGRDALQQLRQRRAHLVLLDVVLPDLSGPEVLQAIRSNEALTGTSVVLLSSRTTSPEQQAEGLDAGADGYIARPVSNAELLARVRLHLRQLELAGQLRESEARTRVLVGSLADAVLLVNEEGFVRYANPAAERLFNRTREELLETSFGIPLKASDNGNAEVIVVPQRESGSRVAEMRVIPLTGDREAVSLVTLHDVTEQQKAREALRESEQRYREMVEHLPDIVFIHRNERIIYVNPAGVRLLRAESESDILEHSPFEIIHPDFHDMVRQRIARARQEPMVSPVTENCLVALDGTQIPVEITAISYRSGEHMDIQVIARDISAQKRAEAEREELLAREQVARRKAVEASRYFRSLFESAPGCYLVLTPRDYEIVAVSEAYLQATLRTREQLTGRKLFDAFPDDPAWPDPDAAARLRASLERVTRDKRAHVMGVECFPIPRPESLGGGFEERVWSIIHSPVPGPDGQLAYIIHRVEDVTEYLDSLPDQQSAREFLASRTELMEADIVLRSREIDEARRKLEESQALLRMASHMAQLGAWTVELPRYEVNLSDEGYEILELPVGSPVAFETAIESYVAEYRTTIESAFRACVEQGIPYDLELEMITAKGRRIWVKTMGEAVRNEQGEIIQVQGAFQDITPRKEAEAREAALQHKIAAMIERIGEGFIMLDDERRISYVNHEVARMLRCKRDDLVGKIIWEAFPEALGSKFEEQYERASGGLYPVIFEEYFPPLEAWIEVRAYPSDEDLAIYLRDVTRERELEERIQRSQRLEAIGQLTGGVAHDFNNLLTVILGNAELLHEQLGPDNRLGAFAGLISSAAQRGAGLTAALLAFARRQALAPVAVDIGELVRGMHNLLHRTLGENIELAFRPSVDLPPAMVDPGQLESAILNLCLNARDAMPDGGRLTIETNLGELDEDYVDTNLDTRPGEYIIVAVSDTGCGIPADDLPRLFEPFFTTKEKGKGTGLGLPMVYGFIKQTGGQVNVYSEPGEGTTVKLYLPVTDSEAVALRADAPDTEPQRGSESILLVEDDDMVRMYAEDLLCGLGYQVTTAADGPEALRVLEEQEAFDLLFTDIIMPGGMNGRQLAERAMALQPAMKVLYTSGYTENAVIHHGRLDPGVNLLSKPYRRAELAERVRVILDEPAPAGEGA
jgi:PAS domain S-box-containing protein